MPGPEADTPPLAPGLALSIGVTGHRFNRLPADQAPIAAALETVLASIAREVKRIHRGGGFTAAPPRLQLVSALAEGADTLAAEAALHIGYELNAVIPFARAEFAKDFAEGAPRDGMLALVGQASRVTEMGGRRAAANAAYEAVGLATLAVSDLLIAVWDGKASAGPGGTAEVVARAVETGVPVIHIHADEAAKCELIWAGLDAAPLLHPTIWTAPRGAFARHIGAVLTSLLAPPTDAIAAEIAQTLAQPHGPRGLRQRVWPGLVWLFGAIEPAAHKPADPQPTLDGLCDPAYLQRIRAELVPLSRAADDKATDFGELHRSGFVINFILAALAVLLAASAIVAEGIDIHWVPWLVAGEITAIMLVILNTWWGNRARWHSRWLQNRHLAEWARLLSFALPLGDPLLRLDPQDAAANDWIRWRVRAAARAIGVPPRKLGPAMLGKMREALLAVVADQLAYHRRTAHRMERIDHRTHLTGLVVFVVSIVVAVAHGWHALHHTAPPPGVEVSTLAADLLTMFSVSLPAFGSAIYGIRLQANFAEMAQRSERMIVQLEWLERTVNNDAPHGELLTDRIRQLARMMLRDTQDWRLTFESRPLALPS